MGDELSQAQIDELLKSLEAGNTTSGNISELESCPNCKENTKRFFIKSDGNSKIAILNKENKIIFKGLTSYTTMICLKCGYRHFFYPEKT